MSEQTFEPREILIEKWLTALESGEYKQGKRKLKTADGNFCCLGVLCEVAGLRPTDSNRYGVNAADASNAVLPYTLANHMGMSQEGTFRANDLASLGIEFKGNSYSCLTNLNDGVNGTGEAIDPTEHATFADVAKIIRDNPEKIFRGLPPTVPSMLSGGKPDGA